MPPEDVRKCLYCGSAFVVPPIRDCAFCRDSKEPRHTTHRVCPRCRDIYSLLSQGKRNLVLEKYKVIPLPLALKFAAEFDARSPLRKNRRQGA